MNHKLVLTNDLEVDLVDAKDDIVWSSQSDAAFKQAHPHTIDERYVADVLQYLIDNDTLTEAEADACEIESERDDDDDEDDDDGDDDVIGDDDGDEY